MANNDNKAFHFYNFLYLKSYMHYAVERSRDDIWGEIFEGRVIFQLEKRRAIKGQETQQAKIDIKLWKLMSFWENVSQFYSTILVQQIRIEFLL